MPSMVFHKLSPSFSGPRVPSHAEHNLPGPQKSTPKTRFSYTEALALFYFCFVHTDFLVIRCPQLNTTKLKKWEARSATLAD